MDDLAAPNSVVFRLGRSYDKRNLPPVVVYQFENGSLPAVLGAWTCRWRVLVAQRLFAPREAGRARLVFGTRNGTIPAFATRNRSRSNSTDFPRLDLRGSRVVPRDSGTLKSQKPNKLSVYTVQKSCGQLLGEIWPRNRSAVPFAFGHGSGAAQFREAGAVITLRYIGGCGGQADDIDLPTGVPRITFDQHSISWLSIGTRA